MLLVVGETGEVPQAIDGHPIALVFVDADHTGEGVRRDILTWAPLVAEGGLMVFDDYGNRRWPEVKPVVDELMGGWEKLGVRGSVAAFRR